MAASMDYANVSGSPDLHGQSPWGSSSPRASRSSFAPPEDPPSPSTPTRDPATSQPQADSQSPSQAPPSGHEQRAEHDLVPPKQPDFHNVQQSQSQQIQQAQQAQQSQQRPGAARYQAARQHRPPPQYKLQAKITALERTGRKDPVLRFDVHVSKNAAAHAGYGTDYLLDEPTQIPNHPIPGCPPNSLRIRKARGAPYILKSRSTSPCRTTSIDLCWGWHRRG
jgi:hypothetical protein